jgi:hypothetical protein
MIPTTFNEETEFLGDSNLNSLRCHYMTFYWKEPKDFFDYIAQSIIDPRRVFLALVIFLPQVFSHRTLRHQRYQRKTTHMIFIQRTSMLHFYPNLTLRDTGTMLRRNLKKIKVM